MIKKFKFINLTPLVLATVVTIVIIIACGKGTPEDVEGLEIKTVVDNSTKCLLNEDTKRCSLDDDFLDSLVIAPSSSSKSKSSSSEQDNNSSSSKNTSGSSSSNNSQSSSSSVNQSSSTDYPYILTCEVKVDTGTVRVAVLKKNMPEVKCTEKKDPSKVTTFDPENEILWTNAPRWANPTDIKDYDNIQAKVDSDDNKKPCWGQTVKCEGTFRICAVGGCPVASSSSVASTTSSSSVAAISSSSAAVVSSSSRASSSSTAVVSSSSRASSSSAAAVSSSSRASSSSAAVSSSSRASSSSAAAVSSSSRASSSSAALSSSSVAPSSSSVAPSSSSVAPSSSSVVPSSSSAAPSCLTEFSFNENSSTATVVELCTSGSIKFTNTSTTKSFCKVKCNNVMTGSVHCVGGGGPWLNNGDNNEINVEKESTATCDVPSGTTQIKCSWKECW